MVSRPLALMSMRHAMPFRLTVSSCNTSARRHCATTAGALLRSLASLANLMDPAEVRLRQARTVLKNHVASSTVTPRQTERCTPGALIPVNYLTGTNAVTAWEPLFSSMYDSLVSAAMPSQSSSPWSSPAAAPLPCPTAPLYQCPFCFPDVTATCGEAGDTSPRDALTWRTPFDMRAHMSWCHATNGVRPAELQHFNSHVVRQIVSRVQDSRHKQPFRAIVLFDTANLELGCPDVLLALMQSTLAERGLLGVPSKSPRREAFLFSRFPLALCCIHELFIPHTAKTTHAVYQLAQAHADSDFFTIYAATRLEAGDLTTAWTISALHDAFRERAASTPSRSCPPIVVVTMDAQQKLCLNGLFGEGVPTLGISDSPVLCPRFLNEASIVSTLREAIDGSTLA